MIVQCPSCGSRYRVNDANVPASGGKITCPSCQHKFIVYPEEQDPAQGAQPSNDMEDKTSVAFRPDLQQLVSKMQQGGGQQAGGPPAGGADAGATEVMSGDSIPDFLNAHGGAPADDGTVEMKNPFEGGNLPGMGGQDEATEDVAPTEVVSGDMLDGLEFSSPGGGQQQQQQHQQQQQQSAPPVRQKQQPPQQPQQQHQQQQRAPQQPPQQQQQRQPQQRLQPQQPQQQAPAQPQQSLQQPSQPQQSLEQPSQPQQQAQPPQQPAGGQQPDFEDADGPAGPDATHDGPWKLKTNFGLTYEFPDTKSLKNWLSNREDLQGYELSGDGDNFHGLDAWPQLQQGQASSSQQIPSYSQNAGSGPQQPPSGPGAGQSGPQQQNSGGGGGAVGMPGGPLTPRNPPSSPSNDVPKPPSPTGKKIEPNEYRPPSRDEGSGAILWGVAVILLLVAAGMAIQLFGVYDIKGAVLGKPAEQATTQPDQPASAPEPGAQGAEEVAENDGPDPEIEKEVNRALDDAERAIENNRLKTARDKLNNVKMLAPERVEIYEMLGEVYTKMGQDKEAEAAKKKASELRAAKAGSDDEAGEKASNE